MMIPDFFELSSKISRFSFWLRRVLNTGRTSRECFIIVCAEAHNSMLLEHRDGAKPEVPHDVGLEDLSDGVSEGERVGSAIELVLILMALS